MYSACAQCRGRVTTTTLTPLSHCRDTAPTLFQRRPHAAATRSHTTRTQLLCSPHAAFTPLLTVPTTPPPSLPLRRLRLTHCPHAAATPPSPRCTPHSRRPQATSTQHVSRPVLPQPKMGGIGKNTHELEKNAKVLEKKKSGGRWQ